MTSGVIVRRGRPDEVMALRHAVLRPHQRREEVAFSRDHDEGAAHFCAQVDEGPIVGVASVLPEAPLWRPAAAPAWRLRGMATAPEWQGKGVGTSVLAAVVKYVAEAGGGLFWCNARLPAVGFYEQAGMSTTGEPWEEPVIGPHIAMLKMVDPAAAHGHRA